MNLKKIWNDPVGGRIITAFIMYIFSTVVPSLLQQILSNGGMSNWYQRINDWFLNNLSFSLSTFYYMVLTLAFFGFIGIVIARNFFRKHPIKWHFNNFIGMEGHHLEASPLWFVKSFEATGVNKLSRPIKQISGHLILDYTGEKFPMKFISEGELKDTESLIAIPPGEKLDISIPLMQERANLASWKGITPAHFLERFVPFTFCYEVDGKLYTHKFSEKEIKAQLFAIIYKRRYGKGGPIFRN